MRLALAGARFGFMAEVLAWALYRADRARVSRRVSAAGPNFEKEFYLRVLACGVRQGTATPALRQALAERLVPIAGRYYGFLLPRNARACLEVAREVWQDYRSFALRLYLSRGGSAVGVVAEASIRVLRSARRKAAGHFAHERGFSMARVSGRGYLGTVRRGTVSHV